MSIKILNLRETLLIDWRRSQPGEELYIEVPWLSPSKQGLRLPVSLINFISPVRTRASIEAKNLMPDGS